MTVRAADVCHMSTSYVAGSRPRVGPRPLFIAHDGQEPADVDRLVRDLGAVVLDYRQDLPDHCQVSTEMVLLVRSRFLMGNPASTLSFNVAKVRELYGLGVEKNLVWCNKKNLGTTWTRSC
jgi:hypothetical protein